MIKTRNSEAMTDLVDLSLTISKFAAILGTAAGFIYVLAYTHNAGVPFPLQIGVLPLTLLAIGLFAFGGTVMIGFGVMIPALLTDDLPVPAKSYLLAGDIIKGRMQTRFSRWAGCFLIPMSLAIAAVTLSLVSDMNSSEWQHILTYVLAAVALFWFVLTPVKVKVLREQWLTYSFMVTMQAFMSIAGYSLLVLLILVIYPEGSKLPVERVCGIAALIFALIYFMATFLPEPRPARERLLGTDKEEYIVTSANIATVIVLGFVVFSIVNPVNAKIGGAVLQLFGIGGGMPIVICLKQPAVASKDTYAAVGTAIKLDQSNCTEPLNVLFDGGDRMYLAKASSADKGKGEDNAPFSIRQEDVLMKRYPGAHSAAAGAKPE